MLAQYRSRIALLTFYQTPHFNCLERVLEINLKLSVWYDTLKH